MNKKTFPELLEELNSEERKKFDYILNFYTEEHVFYNFDYYRHALKELNLIRYENFNRPVGKQYKRLANAIRPKLIYENFENFRTYWKSETNKEVTDFLIYLTSYNNVDRKSVYKIIEHSRKYGKLVENGEITPEEVYEIIISAFDRFSDPDDKIDLHLVEIFINNNIINKVNRKSNNLELNNWLEETDIVQRIIVLGKLALDRLSNDDIREAYAFQGNIQVANDSSILAIKAIMGDRFKELDDNLLERLKSMLRGFNLAKITESEIRLFQDNLDDIINKGYNIEDIFFMKNIVGNENALRAYSELPEELQRQLLKVNVLANKSEISNVLSALSECKEEPEKIETFENLERNISRLPLEKRDELRKALKNKNLRNFKTKLDLDPRITIGFEIEAQGLNPEAAKELRNQRKLYSFFKEKQNIKNGYDKWNIDYDGTIGEEGLEFISPVVSDKQIDWEGFKDACDSLKVLGAYPDSKCGGHIHISANILGTDEKAWENFLEIWRHSEEIIYKISNKAGEELRPDIKFQASPTEPIVTEMLKKGSIKINSYDDIRKLATEYTSKSLEGQSSSGRTKGMNLQCIAEGKQDTIEFRIPNGSIDAIEIQRTANLYARMIQTAKLLSENENYKKDIFEKFKTTFKPEEKLACFLDLLFDDIEDKMVYYDRYLSQNQKLMLSGVPYLDIVDAEVKTDENAKYEWRGHR